MTAFAVVAGTASASELAQALVDFEVFIHVSRADEAVSGRSITRLVEFFERNEQSQIAILAAPIRTRFELDDPQRAKVVLTGANQALYFSRSAIPCARQWTDELLLQDPPLFHRLVGAYAYRRETLLRLAALPKRRLETVEGLEQLRPLEHGVAVDVVVIDMASESERSKPSAGS